jgi:CRISPR-associated protein Cas2
MYLYISYDFSNDKVRTKFSKFLNKFGRRIQYSVYLIKNSPKIIENIKTEIELNFEKQFTGADSIIIIPITPIDGDKIIKYGYSSNDEKDILYFN